MSPSTNPPASPRSVDEKILHISRLIDDRADALQEGILRLDVKVAMMFLIVQDQILGAGAKILTDATGARAFDLGHYQEQAVLLLEAETIPEPPKAEEPTSDAEEVGFIFGGKKS